MAHHSLGQNGLTRGGEARRWPPGFGYGLMIGGSALFWGVAALAISALV